MTKPAVLTVDDDSAEGLEATLRWIAAGCMVRTLARDIETAARIREVGEARGAAAGGGGADLIATARAYCFGFGG